MVAAGLPELEARQALEQQLLLLQEGTKELAQGFGEGICAVLDVPELERFTASSTSASVRPLRVVRNLRLVAMGAEATRGLFKKSTAS